MGTVLPFRTAVQRRNLSICVNEVTGAFRVYLTPPCPGNDLVQEFPTSGEAIAYAARLAARYHFPIRSPGVPDHEWAMLIIEMRDAL